MILMMRLRPGRGLPWRCAATRQRTEQKRALARCGLNCVRQTGQRVLALPAMARIVTLTGGSASALRDASDNQVCRE